MKFKKYVDSQKSIIEDLNNKFKNIKKYSYQGQLFLFSLSMIISVSFINYSNETNIGFFKIGLVSFLSSLFLMIFFNYLLGSFSKIFKSYDIENVYVCSFYNSKQKKEIQTIYENLNEKTKKSLSTSIKFHGDFSINKFLYFFISDYIKENNILNEYQEVISYINKNYNSSYKEALIKLVIEKINKEDTDYFLKNKDNISDYIYSSNLSNFLKKEALSKIKALTEEEIDNLYQNIKKTNNPTIKTKLIKEL